MWSLAVLAFFAAGVATVPAVVLANRFYRFDVPILAAPACWTAAVVLYVAFAPRLSRYRARVWGSLAAVLGLVTVALWPPAMLVDTWADDGSEVVETEVSSDGRHELVTESFHSLIDPSCRVWLRERGGLFSRQALVWEGIDSMCPERVAFADGTGISITEADAAEPVTTTFDPDRLRTAGI